MRTNVKSCSRVSRDANVWLHFVLNTYPHLCDVPDTVVTHDILTPALSYFQRCRTTGEVCYEGFTPSPRHKVHRKF